MSFLFAIIVVVATFLITKNHYKPQTLSAKDLLKDGNYYRWIGTYRSEEDNKEPSVVYSFQKVSGQGNSPREEKTFFVSSNPGIAFEQGAVQKRGEVYKAKLDWTGIVILSPKR